MSRIAKFRSAILLSLVVAGLSTAGANAVFAQRGGKLDKGDEEIRRELLDMIEKRFDVQRRQMLEEIDDVIVRMLREHRDEPATGRVEELERELASLRGTVEKLRARLARTQSGSTGSGSTDRDPSGNAGSGAAFLGIAFEDVAADVARELRIDGGIKVLAVIAGSPADRVGVQEGDVVVRIDDRLVSRASFLELMSDKKPGQGMILTFVRPEPNGKRFEIQMKTTVADKADFMAEIEAFAAGRGETAIRNPAPPRPGRPEPTRPEVRAVERPMRETEEAVPVRLGVRLKQENFILTVRDVKPGSNAAEAGLQPGDVLLRLDDRLVRTHDGVADVRGLLKGGQETSIEYRRGDTIYVAQIRIAGEDGRPRLLSLTEERKETGTESPARPRSGKSGFLGVSVQETDAGLRVDMVVPGSTAATMGLRVDDVIRRVNGRDVGSTSALGDILAELRVGDAIRVGVERGGKGLGVEGKLGERPRSMEEGNTTPAGEPTRGIAKLENVGLENTGFENTGFENTSTQDDSEDSEDETDTPSTIAVAEPNTANAEERSGLGIVAVLEDSRVAVDEILPESPAGAAGIRSGDVILSVDQSAVASFDDLAGVLTDRGVGDSVTVTVDRDGRERTFDVCLTSLRPEVFRPEDVSAAAMSVPDGAPFLGLELEEHPGFFRVVSVHEDGPAAAAGLRAGDEILTVDGTLPAGFEGVRDLLGDRNAGDILELDLRRGDARLEFELILGPGR